MDALRASSIDPSVLYGIKDNKVLRYNLGNKTSTELPIDVTDLDHSEGRLIRVSPDEMIIAVAEKRGSLCRVYNAVTGFQYFQLNRGNHSIHAYDYSFGFYTERGHIRFIGATEHNILDSIDMVTGDCKASPNEDIFHSTLILSPDGTRFLDLAWYWNPVASPNILHLTEGKLSCITIDDQFIRTPGCWMDNDHVVLLLSYTPEESDLDDQIFETAGYPKGTSVIFLNVYDIASKDRRYPITHTKVLESKLLDFENAQVVLDTYLYIYNDQPHYDLPTGMLILDINSWNIVYYHPGLLVKLYHPLAHKFIKDDLSCWKFPSNPWRDYPYLRGRVKEDIRVLLLLYNRPHSLVNKINRDLMIHVSRFLV